MAQWIRVFEPEDLNSSANYPQKNLDIVTCQPVTPALWEVEAEFLGLTACQLGCGSSETPYLKGIKQRLGHFLWSLMHS